MYFALKILAQLLSLTLGVMSAVRAHRVPTDGKRQNLLTKTGWLTIAGLLFGFSVFVGSEITQRSTIRELEQVNRNLLVMRADHDLSGIEISFEPSDQHWSRIAAEFDKLKPAAEGDFPYRNAAMTAERNGGQWMFDFGPVESPQGLIRPPRVLPGDEKSSILEGVINQASIPLWIKWCCGIETEIEPWRYDYSSAIMVSKQRITFTLRPPLLKMNVNSLNSDPTITLRTRGEIAGLPKRLTFRSLDSVIILDQAIDVDWKDGSSSGEGDTYIKKTKPLISGPHKVATKFRDAQ